MYASLGISAEQVYGDMYTAWLRDTHEKNTNDVKRLYTTMIENGFGDQQIFMRRQRLGANFISSLAPLLHQCSLMKLDLHGNMLRDVGCELLVHVLRDTPQLTYLDLGANAIGCSAVVASGIIGAGGGGGGGGSGGGAAAAASGKGRGAASSRGGGAAATATAANAPAAAAGVGGGGARSAASSSYLNAMQGLGAAIAQHKRLSILILGSDREEAYTNQIEVTGAMLVLEGCLLSRSLKRLDLSGNPFAVNDGASGAAAGGGGGGGGGEARRAPDGLTSPTSAAALAVSGRLSSNASPDGDRGAAGAPGGAAGSAGGGGGGGGGGYAVKSAPRTPVQVLAQLLRTSVTLTHLTLRAIGLSDAGAAQLFEAAGTSRSLQQLDISANGLSARVADVAGALMLQRTAAVRGGALGCTLQSLVLSHNDLWDNTSTAALVRRDSLGMRGGLAAVSSSKYASRTRALRGTAGDAADGENPLHPQHQNPSHGLTLLSALSHDQFVTALYLDDCAMDDAALLTLCRALMTNAMLKVLSMRRNSLSPDGVVQLGRALCRHPCLERLLISGNPIEDEGVCALATALGQPDASLVEVDVAKTWLGDRGLIALGVALQTNTSLRALHISDNHFTHHGGASFAALLENNTYVVRCELGATSVPHHIVLRLERTTARNRARAENAGADALKAEVVRLHYQKYKLLEAHLELEALRESNAEVKRTTENFDLQTKQDHGDFVKRIRELEEQIENAQQQDVRYTEQKAKLEADLTKAERAHEEDMTYVAERLAVEVGLREKAEAEMQKLQAELVDWQENGAAREQQKRERLAALKADQEAWATQRRAYRERATELQRQVTALEAAVASTGGGGMSKKRGKSGKK